MTNRAFKKWVGLSNLGLGLFLSAGWTTTAEARLLQIIHTNDLHSYLEHGEDPSKGGYPAVKGMMDQLRQKAQEQGVETLVLDAGDFSEGSEFYLADKGVHSWKIMDEMGYDAIAIGNHDWLIGPEQMDGILAQVRPKTKFVSANLDYPSELPNMSKHIRPYSQFERAGLKIAVVGLATNELVYRWRVEGGTVSDPVARVNKMIPKLRKKNDFVFVLTHLGVQGDLNLVKNTKGIDLVVGGHSHTALFSPLYAKDQGGTKVPLVQTGHHGEYIGDLLVDIEPGKPVKVVHYRLHSVNSSGPQDPEIAAQVRESRNALERRYTPEYFYQTVGFSDKPLERPIDHHTAWGDVCVNAIREAGQADLAIDVGEFYGSSLPPGPITHETIIQAYPRVFDAEKSTGWNVWTVYAPGWLVRLVLDQAVKQGLFLNTANVTYKVVEENDEPTIKRLRINGRKVNPVAYYKVAVSEGIGRGALDISILLRAFMMPEDTGIPIWSAIEREIQHTDFFQAH
jgi:2',3'-cyclic-nucleotide 2'-phosphodiesterase (5'-nucleotidase family)